MTPREVIARAIQEGYETRHLKTDVWLEMADAVIDALEGMKATEAMERVHDEVGCLSATEAWQAMVGAMRDQ